MGLREYLSKNPSGKAEPESNYDDNLVVASFWNFFKACKSISQINKPSKAGDKRKCYPAVLLISMQLTQKMRLLAERNY